MLVLNCIYVESGIKKGDWEHTDVICERDCIHSGVSTRHTVFKAATGL